MGRGNNVDVGSYDPQDLFDEAFAARGEPRDAYATVLDRLADRDLDRTVREVRRRLGEEGCRFGAGEDAEPFRVDLVPRVITADEWAPLAAGLEQRVRALDAFLADAYGGRRIVAEGVMPERILAGAEHFEPELAELPAARIRVALAGLDVIRCGDGSFRVLEDNLRTPSGLAYAIAARAAVAPVLGDGARPIERPIAELLGRALRAAAPCGHDDPRVVLLTDGPENTAYWEHERLAELLGIELVTLDALRPESVDVVYRRTDEDSLRDEDGTYTRVGETLLGALRAGALACVNGLGNGVADDKLVHSYVEDMIRFYLGEEPLVRSVQTYDLTRAGCLEEVLDRLDEMVVKPRAAYGGEGVFIGPTAGDAERDAIATAIRADPEAWVAQETVWFSRHPTVIDGALEPRHVDLRAFVTFDGERAAAVPGGLSRVAFEEGELVVNSSQGGGAKDTWVLPS
ncbi:MAG TPA: circularly permuted type 2 ATP-grasp protein [Solirubrobacteraceae bacterium]|nr:circularly permuted type 2 ATP-grasp protein [Solirubrobacteraceae bacterium]